MLTDKQAKLLAYIREYQQQYNGASPSYRQAARHMGVKSISGIARLVDGLEARGMVRRLGKNRHGIALVSEDMTRLRAENGDGKA